MTKKQSVILSSREDVDIHDYENEENKLFLDGIVRGIKSIPYRNLWSFDHHGKLPRFATLSTTKQVDRAARLGFNFESIKEIHINHIDVDSVGSAYAALSSQEPLEDNVIETIDIIDVNGPVLASECQINLFKGYAKELDDLFKEEVDMMRSNEGVIPIDITNKVIEFGEKCLRNYKFFCENFNFKGDNDASFVYKLSKIDFIDEVTIDGIHLIVAKTSPDYYGGMSDCYGRGATVAMCYSEIEDSDNHIVTIAKKSDFVWLPFNNLMAKLNELEDEINPGNTGWGGGTTIGGSPRPQGTKIPPPQIIEEIKSLL